MFFARWEQGAPWSGSGIEGVSRWLQRVWRIVMESLDHRDASEIDHVMFVICIVRFIKLLSKLVTTWSTSSSTQLFQH
ncbi:MAG: hypothetical protein CM1200mP6_06680 [Anaerolineaceae bacterium]|nr:MAG: hypothetical protein CM1200mP6_06680 [Anaerolineaceae bacterium]